MDEPSTSTAPPESLHPSDKYRKDLALVMFERATRQGYDFRLGTGTTSVDIFNDVAFFNQTKNEWTLIQVRHTDASFAPQISFKDMFPSDELTRENGGFSLFRYLKSYMTAQVSGTERKNVVVFSNSVLHQNSFSRSMMEVVPRPVDEILRFYRGTHVGFKVKDELIEKMVKYVNREFNSLRDSIVKLFQKGVVNQVVRNFKTPVASLLTKTEKNVRFSVNHSLEACQMLASLSGVIDIRTAELPLDSCQELFSGEESRNKTLPLFASEDTVRKFFQDLIFSVDQPRFLYGVIDQDLHLWMLTWIRPDYLTRLEETQFKKISVKLEKYFNEKQALDKSDMLQPSDGDEFFARAKQELKIQLQQLPNSNVNVACDFYINRHIEYMELSLCDKCQDENLLLEHTLNNRLNRHALVRMRDDQFVSELFKNFEKQQFLLLASEVGMGKTTVLGFIALSAQRTSTDCVYLFYLNTFHQALEQIEETDSDDELLSVLGTVLSERSFKDLQRTVNNKNNQTKCLLVFDAFDEVIPRNRNKVLKIFRLLLEIPNVKILLSARNTLKELLENEFKVAAMSLIPFSGQDQTSFLRQFWKVSGENEAKFLEYVAHVFTIFQENENLPIEMKLLAEVYGDHFEQYLNSEQNNWQESLPQVLCPKVHLYEAFVRKWFVKKLMQQHIYLHQNIHEGFDQLFKMFLLEHQLMAIKQLQIESLEITFEDAETLNVFEKYIKSSTEKSPLVEVVGTNCRFIHQPYAEFLLAKFLLCNIETYEDTIFGEYSIDGLLQKYPTIRLFFFALLEVENKTKHLQIIRKRYEMSHDIILDWACESNGLKIVKYLLGTNSNFPIDNCLLYVAVKHNYYDMCKYLLENYKETADTFVDEGSSTPLHIAAEFGHLKIAKMLLDHSLDVNKKKFDKWTPLHLAAQQGNTEFVQLLLDRSAEVNALTFNSYTPLHLAAQNGHSAVAKILLEHSANAYAITSAKTDNRWTPLTLAARFGHLAVVELLLDHIENVYATPADGWEYTFIAFEEPQPEIVKSMVEDCFLLAATYDHLEVLKYLLNDPFGNVNTRFLNGCTALHTAAERNHLTLAEMLIANSANVNAKNLAGQTPLHYAAREGHMQIVKLLTDHEADIGVANDDGSTALDLAVLANHGDVCELLNKLSVGKKYY